MKRGDGERERPGLNREGERNRVFGMKGACKKKLNFFALSTFTH